MKILITSIGSFGSGPSLIKVLRRAMAGIEIVGADITDRSAAMHMVDHPVIVPPYGEEEIRFLHAFCREQGVEILLPMDAHHELARILEWEYREAAFSEIGTTVVGTGLPLDALKRCIYKDRTYELLRQRGLRAPAFHRPRDSEGVRAAARELGYPDRRVLVKPVVSAGNRGMRILDAGHDRFASMMQEKPGSAVMDLPAYLAILGSGPSFPDVLVMEYLPGKDYSVYCLCDRGEPLYVIPQERIHPAPGMSVIARVDLNPAVVSYATDVVRAFGLHGNVNLQMKCRAGGEPVIYEINPRYAGTIVLSCAAGANLAYFGILQATGKQVPRVTVRDRITMIRYADEIFIDEEGGRRFRLGGHREEAL